MAFLNALAWLAMIVCFSMAGLRFWGMVELSKLELHWWGRDYTDSILKFIYGAVIALLWLIFG